MTRGKIKANRRKRRQHPIRTVLKWIRYGLTGLLCLGAVSGMSLGFIFCHDLITQTDLFGVKTIEVKGLKRLTRKTVLDTAKLYRGINIFSVNLPITRKRLLNHPWIAETDIQRIPPDGLTISITEHSPVALIQLDRTYLLNASGEIFKTWSESDPKGLPKIRGLEFSDIHLPGETMGQPLKAVMEILKIDKAHKPALPGNRTAAIEVDREMGITIYAGAPGTEIKLGYGAYPKKYHILTKVLAFLKQKSAFSSVRTIDLKNMNRIVVSPIERMATGKEQKEA